MFSLPSKLTAVKFVGRTLFSTTINYGAPVAQFVLGVAWSNLSWPAICCCAVAALLILMWIVQTGKRACKVALFAGGIAYYSYLAWFVYENLPFFHWHAAAWLCAWGCACNAAVEAATGSAWNAANLVVCKVTSFVLTLVSAAAGKFKAPADRSKVRANNDATPAPAVPTPSVKAKKGKAKKSKPKKSKTAKVNATAPAVPAPVKAPHVVRAVPTATNSEAILKVLKPAAAALSKAYGAARSAIGSVMEVIFTIVPIVDVLDAALVVIGKVDAAVDPIMEVVFTIVPIFDVLAEVLKLVGYALAKSSDALEAVLNAVMDVVCTIVPIFDVLEVALTLAFKVAVFLAVALGKVATFVGKAAAFVGKGVGEMVVAVAVGILTKLLEPLMPVYRILKFVCYTAPRYVLSLVR